MVSAESNASVARRFCTECDRRFGPQMGFCPFDGTPLSDDPNSALADPLIGQIVDDRYVVEEVLGEGGMGRVYRVRHLVLDRGFALKVLRRDLAEDAVLAERFQREARAVAAIHHPNVVAITDFGVLATRQPYFVMQLVEGITLGRLIREKGSLLPHEVVYYARHIARALAAAHRADVVHRDLKPDNVLVSDLAAVSPRVTVLDFGLAKLMGQRRLTQEGVVFGTPQYMSPEQASGEGIDHRVDIYALGVVMFEMLAGHPPFEADTYMGVLTKQLYAIAPRPSQLYPGLGEIDELEEILLGCLKKSRDERIGSMQELIERLDALGGPMGGGPMGGGPMGGGPMGGGPMGGGPMGEARVESVRPPPVESVRPPRVESMRPSLLDSMRPRANSVSGAPPSRRSLPPPQEGRSWPWLVGGTAALAIALGLLLLRARALTAHTPVEEVRGLSAGRGPAGSGGAVHPAPSAGRAERASATPEGRTRDGVAVHAVPSTPTPTRKVVGPVQGIHLPAGREAEILDPVVLPHGSRVAGRIGAGGADSNPRPVPAKPDPSGLGDQARPGNPSPSAGVAHPSGSEIADPWAK